jgi:structural maintenance of chromosome 3 (chondroitin sulfate proteoglycan 6)
VKKDIGTVEQEITQMNGRIVVLNGQMNQVREARERLMDEGTSLSRAKERVKERIGRLETDVEELETELKGLDGKLEALGAELKTPLSHGITAEEEQLIVTLGKEVDRRKKEMVDLSRRKNEVSP